MRWNRRSTSDRQDVRRRGRGTGGRPPPAPLPSGQREIGRRLPSVAARLEVVGDLLVVGEAGQARALDGGDVDEDVLTALIGLDEAKALGGVEPFHGASSHSVVSCDVCRSRNATARPERLDRNWAG